MPRIEDGESAPVKSLAVRIAERAGHPSIVGPKDAPAPLTTVQKIDALKGLLSKNPATNNSNLKNGKSSVTPIKSQRKS